MPQRVGQAKIIAEVARIAATRQTRTIFIGIDGQGGSGKSTLAAAIVDAVPRAVVVHVDDFAAPGIPEWDWERFRAQLLLPLLAGRPARYQRWDWHRDEGAEWHDVPVGRVMLIEGVSSTRHEVGAPWALTVWVDTPLQVRLDRAIERDGPDMIDQWVNDWIPKEDAYVARENPLARTDLVVSGVTTAVRVRAATAADLPVLERDLPTSAGAYVAHLGRQLDGACVFLSAWVEARPVGTALLDRRGSRGEQAAAAHPGVAAVTNVQVGEHLRGHGIGTALIVAAEQQARLEGRPALSISADRDNDGALRLYQRLGFHLTGIVDESRYTWTGADGVQHHEVEHDALLVKTLA